MNRPESLWEQCPPCSPRSLAYWNLILVRNAALPTWIDLHSSRPLLLFTATAISGWPKHLPSIWRLWTIHWTHILITSPAVFLTPNKSLIYIIYMHIHNSNIKPILIHNSLNYWKAVFLSTECGARRDFLGADLVGRYILEVAWIMAFSGSAPDVGAIEPEIRLTTWLE